MWVAPGAPGSGISSRASSAEEPGLGLLSSGWVWLWGGLSWGLPEGAGGGGWSGVVHGPVLPCLVWSVRPFPGVARGLGTRR